MYKFIVVIFSLLLSACSSIGFVNEAGAVTIKKEKPFCHIDKVDPNCKIGKEI